MKLLKRILLIITVVLIACGIYFYKTYSDITTKPLGNSSEKIRFEIEKGETGTIILENLVKKDILQQKQIPYLKVYMRINKTPEMKEGVFRIPKNLTAQELFDLLQNPENPDIWITIREGSRIDQVVETLKTEFESVPESIFNADIFENLATNREYIETLDLGIEGLTSLEGFLFPDKYLIPKQATEEYVIQALVGTFKLKTGGAYTYEDIILASMVEREGMTNADRPIIADIMKRRLNEGWLLQIDATLLYYYKDWKKVLTKEDLKFDQPYNTYTRVGLPPTPICSPSLSSINAVKNSKPNAYYFYIHAKDGTPYYAETYDQHLLNVSKYLR